MAKGIHKNRYTLAHEASIKKELKHIIDQVIHLRKIEEHTLLLTLLQIKFSPDYIKNKYEPEQIENYYFKDLRQIKDNHSSLKYELYNDLNKLEEIYGKKDIKELFHKIFNELDRKNISNNKKLRLKYLKRKDSKGSVLATNKDITKYEHFVHYLQEGKLRFEWLVGHYSNRNNYTWNSNRKKQNNNTSEIKKTIKNEKMKELQNIEKKINNKLQNIHRQQNLVSEKQKNANARENKLVSQKQENANARENKKTIKNVKNKIENLEDIEYEKTSLNIRDPETNKIIAGGSKSKKKKATKKKTSTKKRKATTKKKKKTTKKKKKVVKKKTVTKKRKPTTKKKRKTKKKSKGLLSFLGF